MAQELNVHDGILLQGACIVIPAPLRGEILRSSEGLSSVKRGPDSPCGGQDW